MSQVQSPLYKEAKTVRREMRKCVSHRKVSDCSACCRHNFCDTLIRYKELWTKLDVKETQNILVEEEVEIQKEKEQKKKYYYGKRVSL